MGVSLRSSVMSVLLVYLLMISMISLYPGVSGGDYINQGDYVDSTEKYPFIAFISTGCTGSLFESDKIITASHCFYDKQGKMFPGCGEAVFNDLDKFHDNGQEIKRRIIKVERFGKDLAVATLDKSVNRPLVKLYRNDPKPLKRGQWVKAVGFGMTGYWTNSGRLKDVDLQITKYYPHPETRSHRSCNYMKKCYGVGTKVGPNNDGPCEGDSGGPLLVKDRGEWKLVATLSGGGYNCMTGRIQQTFPDDRWNSNQPILNWEFGKVEFCPK